MVFWPYPILSVHKVDYENPMFSTIITCLGNLLACENRLREIELYISNVWFGVAKLSRTQPFRLPVLRRSQIWPTHCCGQPSESSLDNKWDTSKLQQIPTRIHYWLYCLLFDILMILRLFWFRLFGFVVVLVVVVVVVVIVLPKYS